MMADFLKKNKTAFVILLGTFISCFAAFYNYFPLVYPDTGTYISSGFANEVPSDRPIFYGLFLRHISLYHSLWLVIIMQGFITSYLIYKTLEIFIDKKNVDQVFLFSIVFLSILTGYSFNTSILIPDIFTAVSILCALLLMFHPFLSKTATIFIYILFVFSVVTHFSNVLIIMGLLPLVLLLNQIRKKRGKYFIQRGKIILVSSAVFVSFLAVPTSNYLGGLGFVISNSSHVFILNSLKQSGLVEKYLIDNCDQKDYKYCDYIGDDVADFMWDQNSPLYKTGGWGSNKDEYNEIIKGVVVDPNNWWVLTKFAWSNFTKQLITFHSCIYNPEINDQSPAFHNISWRFPTSLDNYLHSKQSMGENNLRMLNWIQLVVMCLSLLVICFFFLKSQLFQNNDLLKFFILLIILHNLINSFVCANFSMILDRFQNRLIWILPLMSILLVYNYVSKKNEQLDG